MIEHVKNSILKAEALESKLTHGILALDGMCFSMTRHLLNNIVNIPGARYLEVGVHKGATFIAALYKNDYDKAIGIDNWSECGDYGDEFINICNHYIGEYDFIQEDCFDVELDSEINIYFYDGSHTEESHTTALSHFYKSLADEIIFIVDDYNWNQVRKGTMRAVKDWNVLYGEWLGQSGSHHENTTYGAGNYIAILKK